MIGFVLTNVLFGLTLLIGNHTLIYFGFTIGGLFNAPLFAFSLELACEIVFPVGEGSASGFI